MEEPRTEDVMLNDGSHVNIEISATPDRLLLRAVDETGHDVGTATCDLAPSEHPHRFAVDVAEAARGRGIGTALFTRLLAAASDRDLEWLTFTGPADDALLRMAATSGTICARRVKGNLAKSVVLVPERHAA
jgi:GNAT superfamily N-acetyltransferase